MSFGSAPAAHKAALIIIGVATFLQVIAVATVGWFRVNMKRVELTYGLWTVCSSIFGCGRWDTKADFVGATRALEVIGMLLGGGAAVLMIMHIFVDKYRAQTCLAFIGTSFASGICIVIGAIVWGKKFNDALSQGTLFYSFGLAIAAAVLMILSAILGLIGRRDSSYSPN